MVPKLVTSELFGVLAPNSSGRDFFVGDIHGERRLLDTLLRFVDFNTSKDRLISTGDIVDRGPYSINCLKLIREPWFHLVLGNHELNLIAHVDAWRKGKPFSPDKTMGNAWLQPILNSGSLPFTDLVDELKQRPSALVHYGILPHERFHVVHGSLTDGKRLLTDSDVDTFLDVQHDLTARQRKAFAAKLSCLSRAYDLAESDININEQPFLSSVMESSAPLSLTFCGHLTMCRAPIFAMSHLHIDTGSNFSRQNKDCALSLVRQLNVTASGFDLEFYQAGHLTPEPRVVAGHANFTSPYQSFKALAPRKKPAL